MCFVCLRRIRCVCTARATGPPLIRLSSACVQLFSTPTCPVPTHTHLPNLICLHHCTDSGQLHQGCGGCAPQPRPRRPRHCMFPHLSALAHSGMPISTWTSGMPKMVRWMCSTAPTAPSSWTMISLRARARFWYLHASQKEVQEETLIARDDGGRSSRGRPPGP